jgi:hypothetical protein
MPTCRQPRSRHNYGAYHARGVAQVLDHHGCDSTTGHGHRGYADSCTPASQQPPGPHASPSAVVQWHHDVDRIVIAAINTLPHGWWRANHSSWGPQLSVAHSQTPTAANTTLAARAPSAPRVTAASIAMTDLWAELERHRLGEDGRITIECHRERRRNIEGDYGTSVAAPVACATHTPAL